MIIQRVYFSRLQASRSDQRITLLLGARQTGKTTLLRHFQQTVHDVPTSFLTMEDPLVRESCNHHPYELFSLIKQSPATKQIVFLDEIQLLDNPSNFLKLIYDTYHETVKLYVTGSSSFYLDAKYQDSLAGRKEIMLIRGLRFDEYLAFQGGGDMGGLSMQEQALAWDGYVRRGGFPSIALMKDPLLKQQWLQDYLFSLIQKDIYETKIEHASKFFDLMKILADQTGMLVNVQELANTLGLSQPTIEKYLWILQKGFHVALITPFAGNLRTELTKMRKIYRYDLGLRNSLLQNFTSADQRTDRGSVTENIFFREILFTTSQEQIQFRRTTTKQEVDFVINRTHAYKVKYAKKGSVKFPSSLITAYPDIQLRLVDYVMLPNFFYPTVGLQ